MNLSVNSETTSDRIRRPWLSGAVAASLAALVGLPLFFLSLAGGVTRLSYDLPFALRPNLPANEVAIVYLDEAAHRELQQPFSAPWDRSLHAQLIQRLTEAGAKAIVFDILFTDASANP